MIYIKNWLHTFTLSDVKFSVSVRFLKKGFRSDYLLAVAFHVGALEVNMPKVDFT